MLRHLSILLKGKDKDLRHNILRYLATVLPLCLCLIPSAAVRADQTGAVEIIIDSDYNMYDTRNQLYGEICFNDIAYYNESLYISYHLIDAENEDMIQFENERVWISAPNDQGITNVTMEIVVDDRYKEKSLIIQLDIVDTLNQYWLSGADEDIFVAPAFHYERNYGKMIVQRLLKEITDNPIIFGVNCLFSCFFVFLWLFVRKNKVL